MLKTTLWHLARIYHVTGVARLNAWCIKDIFWRGGIQRKGSGTKLGQPLGARPYFP
jgi:hypothetical protein